MNIRLPLPLWLLRRIVRRNPWLLSDSGQVRQSRQLDLGFLGIEVDSTMQLDPAKKARLQAELEKKPPTLRG